MNSHILSTQTIIKGLCSGRHIAPFMVEESRIDSLINQIQDQQMVLAQGAAEIIQLKTLLAEPGLFLFDERKRAINALAVFILPIESCFAFSDLDDENRPIAVLSKGLIDQIASTILLAQAVHKIPKSLDQFYMPQFRRDMDAINLITNTLFIMQVHHYRYGRALPNFFAFLSDGILSNSAKAINGAIQFVLLHELGHHELGHIEGRPTQLNQDKPQFILPEEMSDYQREEMAADQFALDSLIEPARVIGTFWQQQAMAFQIQLEIVSGQFQDEDHPTAINRGYQADRQRDICGNEESGHHRSEHFSELANRFEQTRKHKLDEINALLNTPYERCLAILHEANMVTAPMGVDLSPLWESTPPSWLDIGAEFSEV